MAQEDDYQRLKAELDTLRRENQLLRERATLRRNGHHHPLPETVPHGSLVPAFRQQLNQLKSVHRQLAASNDLVSELQRSLEALIPALEIQLTGWTNEIRHVQQAQEDLEQTYASVVGRLEARIQILKQQVQQASPPALQRELTALQKERENMRRRIDDLESACQAFETQLADQTPETSSQQPADPFTSLDIFGI